MTFDNLFDDLFSDDAGDSDVVAEAEAVLAIAPEPQVTIPQEVLDSVAKVMAPVATTTFWDDPRVLEMLKQIDQLTKLVDGFETQVKTVSARYNAAKAEKEEYLKSVNEQLAQFDWAMRTEDRQRREFQAKLDEARGLKRQIHDSISAMAETQAAEQALQEVEERWRKLEAEWQFAWAEQIRHYQVTAVRFVVDAFNNGLGGVLIADQMGVGKTLEAIAAINVIQSQPNYLDFVASRCPSIDITTPKARTVLWLCPTAIKESTVRELKNKWGEDRAIKLVGNPEMRHHIVKIASDFGMILVVGYEQLRDRKGKPVTPELFEHEWAIVVTDEAHKYKAEGKGTFNNVEKICRKAGFVIPMTGTPFLNKPEEFWSCLHMITLKGIYEGKFAKSWKFAADYLNSHTYSDGAKGDFYHGAYERLTKTVEDMVIRRKKEEVLDELPDKFRNVDVINMDEHDEQRDVYNLMRDSMIMWVDDCKEEYLPAQNFLSQINRLRQINLFPAGVKYKHPQTGAEMTSPVTQSAKLDRAMDLIEELLDNDEKVLVFCNFNDPIRELQARIERRNFKRKGKDIEVRLIIGGQKDDYRANTMDRFNDDDDNLAVVLGNISAMGIGLNLQGACSNAIFLDLFWNPGINEQAEDRLHRMGQKNSVQIHIIHCEDTVDNFIAAIIEDKANMFAGIMDSGAFRKETIKKAIQDGLL